MPVSKAKLIFLGILCGIFSVISFEIAVILVAMTTMLTYISLRYQGDERKFILSIFTFGLALRIIFVIFYYYYFLLAGHKDILGPDGESYNARAWYISRLLTGQDIYVIPSPEQIFSGYSQMLESYNGLLPHWQAYQVGIYSYIVGIIYTVFNYAPLLIKFINSVLSVLTALIIYKLGKELFSKKVARASMVVVMFLPSMFVFSLTSMMDSLNIFLLSIIILLLTRFRWNKSLPSILSIGLATVILCALRPKMYLLLIPTLAVSLFFLVKIRLRNKLFASLVIILIIFSTNYRSKILKYFDRVSITHQHFGYVGTPGNNYMIFSEGYYIGKKDIRNITLPEFALAFTRGMFHFLFEPLPNRIKSKRELFGMIQTIPWIIFFPFVILGIVRSIKYRQKHIQYILTYIIIFSSLMAITQGNVGTAFRHRDMLMPFFILFGVAGVYNFFNRPELTK